MLTHPNYERDPENPNLTVWMPTSIGGRVRFDFTNAAKPGSPAAEAANEDLRRALDQIIAAKARRQNTIIPEGV